MFTVFLSHPYYPNEQCVPSVTILSRYYVSFIVLSLLICTVLLISLKINAVAVNVLGNVCIAGLNRQA